MFTTGDVITKRLGINFTEEEMGDFPHPGPKYIKAPEVQEIGEQIIEKFRPDLRNWEIGYLFKRTAAKSKTGEILGTANKENDKSKAYSEKEGYVTIAFDKWITMDKDQKARLVYHELLHLTPNQDKGVLDIEDHPINEFPEVISIFGPGQESDILFIEAYEKFRKDNSTLIDVINEERALKKQLDEA